jgi:hypothetical protein
LTKNPFSNFSNFGVGRDKDSKIKQSYKLLDNRIKSREIFSSFTENGLETSQFLVQDCEKLKVIQHQISWVMVPKRVLCFRKPHKLQVILEPGKLFEKAPLPRESSAGP